MTELCKFCEKLPCQCQVAKKVEDELKISNEGIGCLLLVAIIALSVGLGSIFGSGYGWLMFGSILFICVVCHGIAK